MWIAVLLVAAVAVWWFVSKSASKKPEKSTNKQPENAASFTFKIETTAIASDRERTPDEEEAYQQAKTIDWDNRVKNGARWTGDVTARLPIKALTNNQYYCLRDATMRYKIRGESDVVEDTGYIKSIKYHPKRTLNSLVNHGLLTEVEGGYFTVTDLGCRAFQELPMRFN